MSTMPEEKLSMVTTEWDGGDIKIDKESNLIQYKDSSGKICTIDNSNDPNRPAKGSDLLWYLQRRHFHRLDSKGIDENGNLSFISEYEDLGTVNPAKSFEPIVNSYTKEDIERFCDLYEHLLNTEIDDIPFQKTDDGYAEDTDVMNENYYNFRMIRDFVSKSTTVNVLTMGNKVYTDVINLNTVRSSIVENSLEDKVFVKVGIQYSDKDGFVTVKDLTFIYDENFHYSVGDIELEYSNRCIRLFPRSVNVVECIITYCYLYYERII